VIEATADPTANGVTVSPDCRALKPSPSCRYSARTSQIPLNPQKYVVPSMIPEA